VPLHRRGFAPTPAPELPASDDPHILTVVFTELRPGTEAQVEEIALPPRGASSICRFYVRPETEQRWFEARISVLYANRVLQTALVTGPVSAPDNPPQADAAITVTTETVVRARMDDLASRRPSDAAVILNHSTDEIPLMTVISDDSPKTVELLSELAHKGSLLYRGLIDMLSPALHRQLAGADLLQVVAAKPDAYFPLEFVYDGKVRREMTLCAHALAAIEQGACTESCQAMPETERPLCPLRFWGIGKVIEHFRHTFERAEQVQRDFGVQTGQAGAQTVQAPVEPPSRRLQILTTYSLRQAIGLPMNSRQLSPIFRPPSVRSLPTTGLQLPGLSGSS
jgi:hypothetical protein